MTNQIQGLFHYRSVGARPPSRPNQGNGPNSPDPFPPFWGGVWARDYQQAGSAIFNPKRIAHA